jgi:hypothetical protein
MTVIMISRRELAGLHVLIDLAEGRISIDEAAAPESSVGSSGATVVTAERARAQRPWSSRQRLPLPLQAATRGG